MEILSKTKLFIKKAVGKAPNVSIQNHVPHQVYGSEYGGWPAINNSLNANSVVYSFGLGEDISFDLSIIDHFACSVYGFDPTPRVHEWLSHQSIPDNFKAYPWGLSTTDGSIRLYAPENPEHISHSINPGVKSNEDYIEVPSKRFKSIQQELGHTRVDVLKMDIEGFEYGVIDDLLTGKNLPKQILIEFHHLMYSFSLEDTNRAIKKLNDAGYAIYYISQTGREFGFLRE